MNHKDLLDWVNNWANKKVVEGKNIKEILTYKNISYWWFINETLFYQLLRKISINNNPKIIHQSQKKRNILLFFTKNISPHMLIVYYIFSSFFFKLIDKLVFHQKTPRNSKSIIIIYRGIPQTTLKEPNYYASIANRLKTKNGNYHFSTVYASSNIPHFAIKTIIDRFRYQREIPHKILESYWSFDIWNVERGGRKHLSKIWENIRENEGFKDSLIYKNKNIQSLIEDILNNYFFGLRFGRNLRDIEMAKRMIDYEKPDIIIIGSEYSNLERAICIAAKLKGIPTLAIQHGGIGPYHPGYIYLKEDISPEGSVESPYCPITDKIVLYGPYDKKNLTEVSSYPENSVIVTGQPRYDILARANEIYNKEKTFEKLNLDKSKKLVVWATNTINFDEYAKKHINAVFDSIEKLSSEVQLVIKKHPASYLPDLIYDEIAKNFGFKPIIMRTEIDTLELLYASDLLIMEQSTVGLEAMILDKPVITLNFSGEPDYYHYAESGAVLGVYNEKDLIINIEKALYDKKTQERLKKAREKFVYEHAYKQDGKATERVCDSIEEMIKESKK
ncbi:hypothetical protein BEH94_06720 [Candidatus Altiarchaeales archaeon WOR_SM1_SCG]|nr:hypothetical protein BEH94_06720 [Candidatus Altiarchaeales archaeon WOR_SM1_SCG]